MNSAHKSRADPLVRSRPPGRLPAVLRSASTARPGGRARTRASALQTTDPGCSVGQVVNRPSETNQTAVLLIIGYGNALYGDDGIGPYAARLFRDHGFDAIETHQLTPELAERIAAATQVIFIDCDARLAPAEIRVTKVEPAPPGPLEHHATPASLLRLALDLYGAAPTALAVGIGPASCQLGDSLSPQVIAAVEAIHC